jgi:hypothetical protein
VSASDQNVRRGVGLVILATALCFVVLIVTGTVESREYFRQHGPPIPQRPYPVGPVAMSCVLLLAEAVALWRLLTASWASFLVRALVAFGASFGGAVVVGMNLMHAPPRVSYHFMWLLGVAALALGSVLISGGSALARRLSASRRVSNREDPLQMSGDIVNTRPSGTKPR